MSLETSILAPDVAAAVRAAVAADDSVEAWDPDPHAHRDHGYPISRHQAELLYLLVRATGATRVAEFATSIGISTLHLAAAVRDNGGGVVIGSEIVPEKAARARASLTDAGLADLVDLREGDALQTFVDLGGPIDLFLLDGWPTGKLPSVDRQVLDLVLPQTRIGTVLVDDNGEEDVLALLRDPASGWRSLAMPIEHGTYELAVRVG